MNILKEIAEKTNKILNENNLEEIGRVTGFMKRKRKITSKIFLETIMLQILDNPNGSLEDLVCEFYQSKCNITKQALHKRFTEEGVQFFQRVLEQLLSRIQNSAITPLRTIPFVRNVKVIDSTEIRLHKKLEKVFPQVRHQGAAIKLQALMNATSHQLLALEITKSKEPDQGYKNHVINIQRGDLLISDLGYFCVDTFNKVVSLGGFFLSRYFRRCNLYSRGNQEFIDLRSVLNQTKSKEVYLEVLMGESKLPCRCVAIRLTEEAYQKRQAHLKKERRRDPRLKEKQNDILNRWTIFVTNIPSSGEDLLQIYSLRWQIELLFKTMKTFLQIRKISNTNKYRVLISLYASLLAMVILCLVLMSTTKEEISLYKAGKIFVSNIRNFITYFRNKKEHAFLWLKRMLCRFALKESRDNRPSTILAIQGIYA